ncbi:H-NS histone family protein [Burkholderia sp. LMG 32019]|uniref:H-NS histone family protein n=1 Tax=Burkholderia sp. LMG 32019 TaxID=3158173 RepID=UPI003C2B0988
MQTYQQIDAEFAQYEAEAAALKQRMDALKERREGMRQQAHNQALPEIVERMTTHGITLEQVRGALAAAKPAVTVIHKYWNPETKETHSGKGTLPGWLIGKTGKDRTGDPRYLNPDWIAKEDAKDAAKKETKAAKVAAKSKTKLSGASVAVEAPASNDATAVPNDASMMADGVERLASSDSAPIVVANVAVVDTAHVETNTPATPIVSNLN